MKLSLPFQLFSYRACLSLMPNLTPHLPSRLHAMWLKCFNFSDKLSYLLFQGNWTYESDCQAVSRTPFSYQRSFALNLSHLQYDLHEEDFLIR